MFEHAGAGDGAFLGDVADEDDGVVFAFGEADQFEGARADLADGAGRAVDAVEPHGLDGIDDDEGGVGGGFEAGGDLPHVDGGGEFERGAGEAEAAGAQADLIDRFFAGDVDDAPAAVGQGGGGLQEEGGFADAGIAGKQQSGAGDQAAAEHAVELGDAGGDAGWGFGGAGEVNEGEALAFGAFDGGGAGGGGVLGDGVPFAAGLAAAGPFAGDGAAGLADEAGGGFRHVRLPGRGWGRGRRG